MRLSNQDKVEIDASRISASARLGRALTEYAAELAEGETGEVVGFALDSFAVLNPGDVTPDAQDAMIRFLLFRLRLAQMLELYEDTDRTLLALSRWGAESAEVFDALEGVVGFWECRPLSGNLFWPAGTRNVPVMPVKSGTGRRRS
ncbi:hypothetical protein [Rhodococcus sp. NPDC006774]|uniref:hypothetical protein n=1 Tax=Rhodococcus sp. NPDC006774 TaxID=3157186 RepID=UPI0034110D6D